MKEKMFLWYNSHKGIVFSIASFFVILLVLVLLIFLLPEGESGDQTETLPAFHEETLPVTEKEKKTTSALPITSPETVEAPFVKKTPLSRGIDVSKWQGKIDWKKVKASGIDFAMIRLGYRAADGSILKDETAEYNLTQAQENGILAGVYFYSGAKTPAQAEEEALWVLERISGFAISYPVVLDHEMGKDLANSIPPAVRTDTALAFLNRIRQEGYGAMLYVPQSEFEDPSLWESDRILNSFPVWVARYSDPAYPAISYPETKNDYAMWQYSDKGRVDGINGNVDLNVAYFEGEYAPPRDESKTPQDPQAPDDFKQTFAPANLRVTAKIEVNLRKIPSIDGQIAGSLKNGEYLICTGISDMGWSRLEYNGTIVYAVTSYLLAQE